MSKSQHGNKEAKKPKKARPPAGEVLPAAVLPTLAVSVAARDRKRK